MPPPSVPFRLSKPRVILMHLTLITVGLSVIAGLVEVVLRLSVPRSTISLFQYNPHTHRYKLMKPHLRGLVYGVPFESNSLGFRDTREWRSTKIQGETRIIVLGDSFTAGAGLPFESTYPQILETLLQERSGDTRIHVMNLAVGGYNIVQYLYTLQEVGLTLDPDAIVIGLFSSNDFDNTDYEMSREIALGLRNAEAENWLRSLYSYRAYGYKVEHLLKRVALLMTPNGVKETQSVARASEGWRQNVAALVALSKIASARRIPLLVVILPYPSNYSNQLDRHKHIRGICTVNGIECLDMLDEFIKSGVAPGKYRLNIIDHHPNAGYNRIVAGRIVEHQRIGRLAVERK